MGSLLLAMGQSSVHFTCSPNLRNSDTSESEIWNILKHSTETVRKVSCQIREVWLTEKFRMLWNEPEHCLNRKGLIEYEDNILSNPRQIQMYLPWLWTNLINQLGHKVYTLYG
jgi:hypothetical protein